MAEKDYAIEMGALQSTVFYFQRWTETAHSIETKLSKADSKQQHTVGVTLYVKPTHLPSLAWPDPIPHRGKGSGIWRATCRPGIQLAT